MIHPLLRNSHGTRPQVVLDDVFPEGIVDVVWAAENRTLLLATEGGSLMLLCQDGTVLTNSLQYDDIKSLVWAHAGNYGAAVIGRNTIACFDDQLKKRWDLSVTGRVTGLAITPWGSHLAISSDSSRTWIVTTDRREVARFDTTRPLDHLQFVTERPQLIGAAEFGHLCCHDIDGNEAWSERISNNVGGMSVTGCGRRILLAAFNHGIQMLTGTGQQRGAFMVDGIPGMVSAAATKKRIAALTLESRIYWLNFEGKIMWAVDLSSDPPTRIVTGPLGDRLFLSTESGRLLQLVW